MDLIDIEFESSTQQSLAESKWMERKRMGINKDQLFNIIKSLNIGFINIKKNEKY